MKNAEIINQMAIDGLLTGQEANDIIASIVTELSNQDRTLTFGQRYDIARTALKQARGALSN